MYAIGIDIGGTNLRIGLVNESDVLSGYEQYPQADILKDNAPEKLADFIDSYIKRHNAQNAIIAICAAFPAAIDKNRAVVLNAPNISGFNGVNVKSLLQKRLGIPVFIEKDVNALLFYDLYRYKINHGSTTIACYIGTGLGNSIYINGKIHNGFNGVAGELGHIPSWDNDNVCTCGNKACVEAYVGGKHLDMLQKNEFPNTPIGNLFAEHGNSPMLDKYVRRLAAIIATEINIIDPQTVILGGGVPSMAEFPLDRLIQYIRQHSRKPMPENNLVFVCSESTGENGVIGAGALAWNQTKDRKTHKILLCPSMMCADFGNLQNEVESLEQAGCDIFHIDIMDGKFVPNFGMGFQDTEFIIKTANKPVDVHLMIQDPGDHVETFASLGASIIYIHIESDIHSPRTLQKIIDAGAMPGIAINPGTAFEVIEPLLSLTKYVLVMTVNPGFAGQKYLSFVDKKIDKLLEAKENYDFNIIIDGACSPEKIAALNAKGVDGFVLGTSALFNKGRPYADIINELRKT